MATKIDYDGRRFRSVSNSPGGDVSGETTFDYRQEGEVVQASYSGGGVRQGQLMAIADGEGRLEMRYHHVGVDGELCTGRCRSTPEVLADGRLRLHEEWHWTGGREGSGSSVVEEVPGRTAPAHGGSRLELVTVIVETYDEAIDFFQGVLGFELVEDSPSLTTDGRPKRWVVVAPSGGGTALLLAQADGADQRAAVGRQFAGRVGLFLRTDDFDATFARLEAAGGEIVRPPRSEPYGTVAVFADIVGNRWDLLGPAEPE